MSVKEEIVSLGQFYLKKDPGRTYSCVLRSVKFNDMFHDSRISKIDIFLVLTIWMNAPDPLIKWKKNKL